MLDSYSLWCRFKTNLVTAFSFPRTRYSSPFSRHLSRFVRPNAFRRWTTPRLRLCNSSSTPKKRRKAYSVSTARSGFKVKPEPAFVRETGRIKSRSTRVLSYIIGRAGLSLLARFAFQAFRYGFVSGRSQTRLRNFNIAIVEIVENWKFDFYFSFLFLYFYINIVIIEIVEKYERKYYRARGDC